MSKIRPSTQIMPEGSPLQVLRINAAGDAIEAATPAGGSLTVQDENANVATGVTQIDFQGAGVTATAGTGEVVVTITAPTVNIGRHRITATGGELTLTFGATPLADSPLIWKNGAILWPVTDYTVSPDGLVVTFQSALTAGDVISDYYLTLGSPGASSLGGGVAAATVRPYDLGYYGGAVYG